MSRVLGSGKHMLNSLRRMSATTNLVLARRTEQTAAKLSVSIQHAIADRHRGTAQRVGAHLIRLAAPILDAIVGIRASHPAGDRGRVARDASICQLRLDGEGVDATRKNKEKVRASKATKQWRAAYWVWKAACTLINMI
jgi:hypothetical protein